MNKPVNSLGALRIAAGQLAALSADDGDLAWMMIMPAGTFTVRDGRGPFSTGSLQDMQAIVARTLKHFGETEMMVDYDHQIVTAKETGGTARAAGWIKKLEARSDGIWAAVKWTDAARTAITAQEYRYLSPLFTHDKAGKVQMLLNVALLNMPALDLDAIAASLQLKEEPQNMEKIIKALGLKDGASEDVILAALGALVALRAQLVEKLELKPEAKDEEIVTAASATGADLGKVASALGLKADANEDEVVALAGKLREAKSDEPDPAKFVPIETVKALQTELKEFRDEVRGKDAESKGDEAIKAGKLIPAQRDWGLKLCASDPKAFDEYVGGAPELTKSQMADRDHNPVKIEKLSAEQSAAALALGIPADDYLKTLQEEAAAATA